MEWYQRADSASFYKAFFRDVEVCGKGRTCPVCRAVEGIGRLSEEEIRSRVEGLSVRFRIQDRDRRQTHHA